jgi:cytoskeletal protein RodZ
MGDQQKPAETLGEYLVRERELRSLRLEEISQRSRISLKVLQALEEDDGEALPAAVYVRGFLRAYARHVGLDESELLLRYEDRTAGTTPTPPRRPVRDWEKKRAPRWPRGWLLLLVLGMAMFAAYWFWLRSEDVPLKGDEAPPAAEEPRRPPLPPGPDLRPIPMPPPPPDR